MHGQVKQSGNFAFVRIFYAGHEVPFYQPLVSLEMLERVLAGKDVATGDHGAAAANYTTAGPSASTFREGNGTVQFDVVPANATYNVSTAAPNPVGAETGSSSGARLRRGVARRARQKPLLRRGKRWV